MTNWPMRDYSVRTIPSIRLNQALVFMRIVSDASFSRLDHIKNQYLDTETNFEAVLVFLSALNIVFLRNDRLKINEEFDFSKNKNSSIFEIKRLMRASLTGCLLEKGNPYSIELAGFFKQFDSCQLKMDMEQKVRFKSIRNILMELDVISYDINSRVYSISDEFKSHVLELLSFDKGGATTPGQLRELISQNEKIGRDAELAVIQYEKDRLAKYPHLANAIEHVADKNTNMGYDIKSFELPKSSKKKDRFIEVKAVSSTDYKFYWSRNEIEAASKYATRYYLYLLPVDRKNSFNFKDLRVIAKPYNEVFLNSEKWVKTVERYLFYRNEEAIK